MAFFVIHTHKDFAFRRLRPHPVDKATGLHCDQTIRLEDPYSQELFQAVGQQGYFDLLCALSAYPQCSQRWGQIPQTRFAPRWPGYTTAAQPYHFQNHAQALYRELVQRSGVKPEDFQYQGFLSTVLRPEIQALIHECPQRRQVEEFFKFHQAFGWHRSGALNLNIPSAQLTMSSLAQAAVSQLCQRLGKSLGDWNETLACRSRF